jgi:hypothetical protein
LREPDVSEEHVTSIFMTENCVKKKSAEQAHFIILFLYCSIPNMEAIFSSDTRRYNLEDLIFDSYHHESLN